jgi:hypothetical protein
MVNHTPQKQGDEYVISWENTNPDRLRRGRGTKRFSKAEAEALAAELNRDYPWIHHRAELV